MTASTLETAVSNVITRVAVLEKLAVTSASEASKDWVHWSQSFPYFVNRCASLSEDGHAGRWRLVIEARLIISAWESAMQGATTPQTAAWGYIPAMMSYFRTNRDLAPTGYTALDYMTGEGVTIRCDNGLTDWNIPGQSLVVLYAGFNITVPLIIVTGDWR